MASKRTKLSDGEHVHVVFPPDLLKKVDERIAQTQAAQPGASVTRSDIVRMAVYKFLED